MKQKTPIFERTHGSGLVIAFPTGVRSLFNPQVHRLVREVESRLDGIFVTYALSSPEGPGVEAAVNAARFAGCSSAVILHAEDWVGDFEWIDSKSDTLWARHRDSSEIAESAALIAEAFDAARNASGLAA